MRKLLPGKLLLLFLCAFSFSNSFAQNKIVSGIIKDDGGHPLIGATVTVKNTKVTTASDNLGAFRIEVPPTGKVLVFSYVGMQSRKVPIGASSTYSVVLNASANALSDVVVVGYGKAKEGKFDHCPNRNQLKGNGKNNKYYY